MAPSVLLRWSALFAFLATLFVLHCTANDWTRMRSDGEGPARDFVGEVERVSPACDPDGVGACPDDWFICTIDGGGGKHCEGQQPAVPDGGVWECHAADGRLVCEGDHMPAGGDWECGPNETGGVIT